MNNAFLLTDKSTLLEAIKALDDGGIGFLAFINEHNVLLGILTDGDLRRGILEQKTHLIDIINKNPITAKYNTPKKELIEKLKKSHRRNIPLVDNNNIFKGVFSLDDIEFISKENVVVIMAGGLGTRLGELTKNIPKPMLDLAGRPIIQHIIELFRDQGFRKFIICVNYKKEIIQNYLKDGEKLGVTIKYVIENKRMGTAGALTLIQEDFDKSFFLINADVVTNMDFSSLLDFHETSGSLATMCIKKYEYEIPYGVVNVEGHKITSIEEKPKINFNINTGIYVLTQNAINYIPKNQFFDMPELFEVLEKKEISTAAYLNENYWIDIGLKEQLVQAKSDMEER